MNRPDYRVHIERLPDEEGGGFVATVPDLPGCMSDGETYQEALENVQHAVDAWIDCAERMGRPLPEPTREQAYA